MKKSGNDKPFARLAGPPPVSRPKPTERAPIAPEEKAKVAKAPTPAPKRTPKIGFPIVGVGASAGGLEALDELFSKMPNDAGMGFVVVTHQHPGHTSLLPELLGKATTLPVHAAADGMKVEPGHVYIGPPGGHLAILNGVLHRLETEKLEAPRQPIDYFLRSLALDQKERAICIILSGTGTDGTLGLKAIKGESGMAMVQQAESAKYAAMPSSAMATGLADCVLPPKDMPRQLVAYARGPYLTAPVSEETATLPLEPLQKIFVMLRLRTGHDFSSYKSSTIRRRIERRMSLHEIQDPSMYVRYLQENPQELDILFKELLISVTNFFRDPEAFEALGNTFLPELIKSRPDGYTFRFWVPGCSSGEEAFSLAILARECLEAAKRHGEIQIFGTDLDNAAIDTARLGQYPDGIAVDVSPQRLSHFFLREDATYRIRKEVRELAIFAVQNVIKDPPFTKLDLISCRNLLIYMNADLQKRLLPVFHYALKPGGLLMLGTSETIGGFTDLFEVVDKKWKIFRRKEALLTTHPVMEFVKDPARAPGEAQPHAEAALPREPNLAGVVDRFLLARYSPACVLTNEKGDVVYIHGRTGSYLEPSAGQPRLNIFDMAREGLQLELATAMRQAASRNSEVVREGIRVKTNGDFVFVNLGVIKLNEPDKVRGLFLISFNPRPIPPEVPKSKAGRVETGSARVKELERELQFTKQTLQTTIEELETSNEELKSTNEELQSTNEEMQSTNEELETSKEEMQSLNEELTTVNTEMQSKVEELSRANDDMQNLLNSIQIATVFLDSKLNIKRFTEQTKRLINLIQSDIGRPLSDLVSQFSYSQLVPDCQEVLRTLASKQAEVQTRDGHWYLMRIVPYRTAENVIDGVVLTFVDINPVKEAQQSLRRLAKVFTDGLDPILIVDLAGRIVDLNDEAVRTYGWRRDELMGQPIHRLIPKEQRSAFEERLQRCRHGENVRNIECVGITKSGRELPGRTTLCQLLDEQGKAEAIGIITKHLVG